MSNNDKNTTKTLKQKYDELNIHIQDTDTNRKAFEKVKNDIEQYHVLVEAIFKYFSEVNIERNGKISLTYVTHLSMHRVFKQEQLQEVQKILDKLSPEKIELTLNEDDMYLYATLI